MDKPSASASITSAIVRAVISAITTVRSTAQQVHTLAVAAPVVSIVATNVAFLIASAAIRVVEAEWFAFAVAATVSTGTDIATGAAILSI